MQKPTMKKQFKNHKKAKLDLFLKIYIFFQLKWDDSLNKKIINNVKVYCLLLRLINLREISISAI